MKKLSKSRLITFLHEKEHGNQKFLADYLQTFNIPFAISPCHNKDINKKTGELVKPHYHVVLIFEGPTTLNNVICNIIQPLGDPLYAQFILSLKGIELYLTHSNNKNKVQYDKNKIYYSDNYKSATLTHQDKCTNLLTVLKVINDQDIQSIFELVNYFLTINDFTSIDFVSSRTYFFSSYINSRGNKVARYEK